MLRPWVIRGWRHVRRNDASQPSPVVTFISMLVPLTPEENERRFKECMEWIHNLTREELVGLMGEEWLEDYRRQFP